MPSCVCLLAQAVQSVQVTAEMRKERKPSRELTVRLSIR